MVHFYVWLLADYKLNSSFSSVAIVSFLERICDPAGLDLEPMLYQVLERGGDWRREALQFVQLMACDTA